MPGAQQRANPRAVAVPSFFTLMNLLCGFLSVVQLSEGRLGYAAWLIVLAAFFDLLDGMMARLTHSASEFGVQLDSLADIVSFGIAPSFLVYSQGLREFGTLGVLVASLPALCGAVRLARYNVTAEPENREYFRGLPIPAQAAILVSFVLTFDDKSWFDLFSNGHLSVLIPLVVVLSVLMVSTIRFDALPRPTRRHIRSHRHQVIAFVTGVLLMIFLQETGLFISMLYYLAMGVGRELRRVGTGLFSDDDEEEAPVESESIWSGNQE